MFVTALLAVSLAAPVPKAKAAELYYPTVEGTKRVMQTRPGGRTAVATETVTKVTEKDGTYTVTIAHEINGRTDEVEYRVSEEGVFLLPDPGDEKGEPAALLKLPAKEGDTWMSERPGRGNVTFTATYTVGKEEEVEVPAGKFKAVPVTFQSDGGGLVINVTRWYAAGVGVVRVVSKTNGTERVQELKEFTPGKAK